MHEGEKIILDTEALADALIQLDGWELRAKEIIKTYTFDTYMDGIEFVNEVAKKAEEIGHHPDIFVHYKKIKVGLWTHKYNAITKADTEMAAIIDKLYLGA